VSSKDPALRKNSTTLNPSWGVYIYIFIYYIYIYINIYIHLGIAGTDGTAGRGRPELDVVRCRVSMRPLYRKVDVRLPGKGNWHEAGPPNHHDDKVDSDQ